MEEKKILFSTWGMPAQWKDITYTYDEMSVHACTTLKLLSKKYDRVILFVLDSIADFNGVSNSSQCGTCYSQSFKDFIYSGSYSDVISSIEERTKKMLACLGIEDAEVIVLPAKGKPGGRMQFNGDVKDYLSIALLSSYIRIKEDLRSASQIGLDITHGINFLPTLTFQAVMTLMYAALISGNNEKIWFKVYNSDPATPLVNNVAINVMYEREVSHICVEGKNVERAIRTKGEKFSDLSRHFNMVYSNEVYPLISTLLNPFPLAAAKLSSISKIDVQWMLNGWIESSSIDLGSVFHDIHYDPVAIEQAVIADAFLNRMREFNCGDCCDINLIDKITKEIYKKVSLENYYILEQEISDIRRKASDYQCGPCKPNKRIMVAHGGFQKECVEVQNDHVKYCNWDKIFEFIKTFERPR
ncbi:CRISPR-associated CARF protein Csx1 [Thermoplasma sp. Kam2015]|uniref:CRISPR-associated CARF protein Csx1 n=1 Tax=Thermoplasma sp. Kam2015 TaxID=2094122 RepID=UPI00137B1BF8|nr:CRISPR-associated CARF protein Csx1 [Thermoplasma sp. Kam2015]